MSLLPGDAIVFMSANVLCPNEDDIVNHEDVYSVEFLNTIKSECPIMLLRNIDQ